MTDTAVQDGVAVSAPTVLAPELDQINNEIKSLTQWVVWKLERTDTGKYTKRPYNARTRALGNTMDHLTWSTFPQAVDAYMRGGFDGVGFVFSPDDGYAGLDLDNCRDPLTGVIAPWATKILDKLQTYCEVSPSGTGVKAFCKAEHPGAGFKKTRVHDGKSIAIEMYDKGRYFTATGYRLTQYPADICVRHKEYESLHAQIFPLKEDCPLTPREPVHASVFTLTENELLDLARTSNAGSKFTSLWNGDIGTTSHSEADLSLCNSLAFWFRDPSTVDSLFRRSMLMRDKWDEKRGTRTYGQRTIDKAFEGRTDFYSPPGVESATTKKNREERRAAKIGVTIQSNAVTINAAKPEPVEAITPWPEIMELGQVPLPEFPIDCLPPVVGNYAQEIARSVQVPIGMAAFSAIGVISSLTSRVARVHINGTHTETLNLFTLVVSDPGTRKTSTMEPFTKPIEEIEIKLREADVPRHRADMAIWEANEKRLGDLKTSHSKAPSDAERDEIETRIREFSLTHEPPRPIPSMIVQDVTTEQLATILSYQPDNCIAMLSDEGGIFSIIKGQYAKDKSSAPNMDVYLKAWSGSSYKIDRKTQPPITIPAPMLTVTMMVQPETFASVATDGRLKGNGFLDRFLYCIPENMAGNRPFQYDPPAITGYEGYQAVIDGIWSMDRAFAVNPDKRRRYTLELDAEALKLYGMCYDDINRRMADYNDLSNIIGWASKLHGNVARIAANLHMIKYHDHKRPHEVLISGDTMAEAWEIGHYCIPHALAAYGIMQSDPLTSVALRILKWVKRKELKGFRFNDLYVAMRHEDTSILEAGLLKLANHGYLRQEVDPKQASVGRKPSAYYAMNPDFMA